MKSRLWLTGLLVCALGTCARADEPEYAAVFADGSKIGYMMHQRIVTGGQVHTTETMHLTIARGGVVLPIGVQSTTIETTDGEPIRFEYAMDAGLMKQKTRGTIRPDGRLEVVAEMMGTTQKQVLPWPKGALMSEGLRLLELKTELKEGESFTATVFEPSLLSAIEATVTVGPVVEVDLLGRVVRLTETTVVMQTPSGQVVTKAYVDEDLNTFKSVTEMLGMRLEIIACDKTFALSPNDVVDFLDKMLVPSPQPLEPTAAKAMVYHIVPTQSDHGLQFPATDYQQVDKAADGSYRVTVRTKPIPTGQTFPYKGKDAELLEALKPTTYLQCDQEAIQDLARQAVGSVRDAGQAAKKIEAFVDQYVSGKNLSVGYGTALEVVASRQGDCTEHAVLTAAMCRAIGIPARVVFGLVYVDEFLGREHVFGGHAWAEAWVGDTWVGLDATRSAQGFGPGYITLARGHGDPKDFFGMIHTLGYFRIAKIESR